MIDTLSRDVDRALPPIEGPDDVFHDRWMSVVRQGRAIDVERLLPGLLRGPFSTLDEPVDAP